MQIEWKNMEGGVSQAEVHPNRSANGMGWAKV